MAVHLKHAGHAGLMLLNLVWFLWVARSFEYKAIEHPTMRQAPASGYKPQGVPAWVQPQNVQGVQHAHVSSHDFARQSGCIMDCCLPRSVLCMMLNMHM